MTRHSVNCHLALFFSCLLLAVTGRAAPTNDLETLTFGNSVIRLRMDPGLPLPRSNIVEWVRRAAVAVTNYLGCYPVKSVVIEVSPGGGDPINSGVTHGGSRIDVQLGPDARWRNLRRDWILTHEMFHLAFPTLKSRYSWMMEGLSDYLEPVARARVGQLRPQDVWREFVEGLPQGLPLPGQRGLDYDDTRERIYWGGNLFWLIADLRIRAETGDHCSVDTVIRAILRDGGNGSANWSLAKVIKVGDQATGTKVLKDLYEELGTNPGNIDLDALWKKLGIQYDHGRVTFDNSAPWAKIRASITSG